MKRLTDEKRQEGHQRIAELFLRIKAGWCRGGGGSCNEGGVSGDEGNVSGVVEQNQFEKSKRMLWDA